MTGGKARSIRSRVLAIVLIPCVSLLIIGAGSAGYLIYDAVDAKKWSTDVRGTIDDSLAFNIAFNEERKLSLIRLSGNTAESAALEEQRGRVDQALAVISQDGLAAMANNPEVAGAAVEGFARLFRELAAVRQRLDLGQIQSQNVYAFYNQLMDAIELAQDGMIRTAPDADTAIEESTVASLFQIVESMSRAHALASGAVAGGGFTGDQHREYVLQSSGYHARLQKLPLRLTDQGRSEYAALVSGEAWKRFTSMETALIDRGPRPAGATDNRQLPVNTQSWQDSASEVRRALLDIARTHHEYAGDVAATASDKTVTRSLLAGAAVLVVALLAFLVAARLSATLVGRLRRLRQETLSLADDRLPSIVHRLRGGEQLDLAVEVPALQHGRDEIGQVADAFNKAQHTAVAAAAQEASMREGLNAVFLNIAHRSQVVVHRQLEVLDEAESKQQDPEHLELLFRLDHLTTRARRNAENLVILAGGKPGRQWRNPVSLVEIVRSAVSETEDYVRVSTAQLPEVFLVGTVVADLIHLLAELVDNATTFSPPESRVTVRGNIVGKGVVVEVEDQGLGLSAEKRDEFNAILRRPPDFDMMALSEETQLGLFVVARLAARHGINVTLTDSAYGGVHAIVLIPATFMAQQNGVPAAPAEPYRNGSAHRSDIPRHRHSGQLERVGESSGTHEPMERRDGEVATSRHAAPEPRFPTDKPLSEAPTAHLGSPSDLPGGRQSGDVVWPAVGAPGTDAGANGARTGQPRHGHGGRDHRPRLPNRRRQTNLAPQLRASPPARDSDATPNPAPSVVEKTPDQVRDVMGAFQRGTRMGRQAPPHPES